LSREFTGSPFSADSGNNSPLSRGGSIDLNIWLFLHHAPTSIGIKFRHDRCCLYGGFAQVFLQERTVLAHNERHHPGIAVFCRVGNKGEPTYHLPPGYVLENAVDEGSTVFLQPANITIRANSMNQVVKEILAAACDIPILPIFEFRCLAPRCYPGSRPLHLRRLLHHLDLLA
jgi:hypothetical protein